MQINLIFLLLSAFSLQCSSIDPYSFDYQKYMRFHWKGSVTSHSIIIKAFPNIEELEASQYNTFLVYYTKPSGTPTGVQIMPVSFPNEEFTVSELIINSLTPLTPYFYTFIFSQGSSLISSDFMTFYDLAQVSEFSFKTFNPALKPHNFTFGAASCAQTGSTHPVFQTIKNEAFDFFIHMGDLHYEDIHRNDLHAFYRAYYYVFSIPIQRAFYESVPIFYVFDDHDFGKNDAQGTSASKPAATSAFKKFVPHGPLKNYLPIDDSGAVAGAPAGETNPLYYLTYNEEPFGIFRSFIVGRCLVIIMDLRSFQDVIPEDILGDEQKNWIENQIRYAGHNSGIQQLIFVSSVPWINKDGGILKEGSTWDDYKHTQGWIGNLVRMHIYDKGKKAILIAGDAHMIGLDDGRNNNHGGFPVIQAASLDRKGSCKGGPYSHGAYRGKNQFGRIEVTDYENETICIKIYLKHGTYNSINYDTCNPLLYPSDEYTCPISWRGWLIIGGCALGGLLTIGLTVYCIIRVRRKRLNKAKKNLEIKNDKIKYSHTSQDSRADVEGKPGQVSERINTENAERQNTEEKEEIEQEVPLKGNLLNQEENKPESLMKLPAATDKSELQLKTKSDAELSHDFVGKDMLGLIRKRLSS